LRPRGRALHDRLDTDSIGGSTTGDLPVDAILDGMGRIVKEEDPFHIVTSTRGLRALTPMEA
jgi:hypothetical protein